MWQWTCICYCPEGQLSNFFSVKLWLFSFTISLNICFGCSKEPSHRDGSFEHPQHSFGREIRKIIFWYAGLSGGLIAWIKILELVTYYGVTVVVLIKAQFLIKNTYIFAQFSREFNQNTDEAIWSGSSLFSSLIGKKHMLTTECRLG